jgi:hypothetical protein
MNTSKSEKLAASYAGRRVLPFYHTPVFDGRIKKAEPEWLCFFIKPN